MSQVGISSTKQWSRLVLVFFITSSLSPAARVSWLIITSVNSNEQLIWPAGREDVDAYSSSPLFTHAFQLFSQYLVEWLAKFLSEGEVYSLTLT